MAEKLLLEHHIRLARYNLWATAVLYKAVDQLDEVLYRKDVNLFFKSVHGTLNRTSTHFD
jgi:uncharacterized damage-inducible protein DinB